MHRRFSTLPEKLHGFYIDESLEQAFTTYFRLLWGRGCISLIDIQKIELMLMDAHPNDESTFCIIRVSFKDQSFFYDVCNVSQGDLDISKHSDLIEGEEYPIHLYKGDEKENVVQHLEELYPDPTAYLFDPVLDDTYTVYGSDLLMHLEDHCEP